TSANCSSTTTSTSHATARPTPEVRRSIRSAKAVIIAKVMAPMMAQRRAFCFIVGHMSGHDHDHHHDHDHPELSETQLRVRALETVLTEKGYVDPAALDAIVEAYETRIGPHNGAAVVAKAWCDPAFKQGLLADASKAVLRHVGRIGDHLVAVENTPKIHNMVV